MKAVVLSAFGETGHFHLKETDTPVPKKGEVRVRIKAAGFNPVDFKIRKGMYGGAAPLILGADCSGTIDALGPETKGFSVGDEVYAMPFGQCSNGAYAEALCLPAAFVARKPKNLSFDSAAAIPLAALTAYRAVIASSAVKKGDALFFAGAGGGVGSMGIPLAKYAQAGAIFTVAGSEESAQFLCGHFGLRKENIVLYQGLSTAQMAKELIARNQGRLFDATFDFVGEEMKQLCMDLTCHSGHFASIVPESKDFSSPVWERGVSPCFNKNLSVHFIFVGAEAYSGPPASWEIYGRHLNHINQLLESGALQAPAIKTFNGLSVENVVSAHQLLEGGRVKGKLVMTI